MKNILIISDTHGNIDYLDYILNTENVDYLIHLGDDAQDFGLIQQKNPNIKSCYIYGNSDMDWMEPKELLFEIYGIKIYATHGHIYNSKMSLNEIIAKAKSLDVDIVLVGHSHIQKCIKKDNIIVINPGSLSLSRERNVGGSYTLVNFSDSHINVISKWFEKEELLGLEVNTVRLEKYNTNYKGLYEQEKNKLLNLLKENILQIEHVGSTSLPGIMAKPIIDIVVAIKDISNIKDLIQIMIDNDYQYRPEDDRHKFIKCENNKQTHHIYFTTIDNYTWIERVRFRDYMLTHPEDLKEYEKIKVELSKKYADDRRQYVAHKREFINEIHKKAKNFFES